MGLPFLICVKSNVLRTAGTGCRGPSIDLNCGLHMGPRCVCLDCVASGPDRNSECLTKSHSHLGPFSSHIG